MTTGKAPRTDAEGRPEVRREAREREVEGTIEATLPKELFTVRLDSGDKVTASIGKQAKRITVKFRSGDRVSVLRSAYDPTRGRILSFA